MDPKFAALVKSLAPSFQKLISMKPIRAGKFPPNLPKNGVYLFSERGRHLYVGRSNNIRGRFGRHCNPGATHRMAAFAFRLARKKTGRLKPSYKADVDSRRGLMADTAFADAFDSAKKRIRMMEFRCVEERDQTRQALLEIYCAVALSARHNDFATH